jgi:hypothetical protein
MSLHIGINLNNLLRMKNFTKISLGFITCLIVLFACSKSSAQTLYDSFADGNFTASPVWGGNTTLWGIQANSDAAAGATGSNTIRLNGPATAQTDYLSSQVACWGGSQEWGVWFGRRAQAYTGVNQQYFWLYANEATLNNATVDGYRLAIGDDSGNDEIRLEYIVNGAVSATVITSTGAVTNAVTDVGFLVRVTRSRSGVWSLFTSTLPTATGTGAIATAIPNSANANVSQGSGTNTSLSIASNGYLGVASLHSTGASAIVASEYDQIYFTTTSPSIDGSICASEYGTHTDGNNQGTNTITEYMTWDDTNLYIGIGAASNNSTEASVFYFDVNPITPVNGGANSDGSTTGFFEYDRSTVNLPFRGDFVVYFKSGYYEFRTSNGSGGWTTQTTTGLTYAESGSGATQSQEILIPWSTVPGGVRPASFNWTSQKIYNVNAGNNGIYGQQPSENPGGAQNVSSYTLNYLRYYTVSVTTVGSSTMPFSRNSYTHPFGVTNNSFGAITVWDFTMNSSGQQIARLNSGGNWVINNNLVVNAGSIFFGSGGAGYGTTAIAGNVSVTGGLLSMDQTNQSMNVTGNVSIAGGTLTLSGTVGGDLALAGNWTLSSGTFNASSRAVTFNSSTAAQTLTGNTTFAFLTVNNTSGTPTLTLQSSSAVTASNNVNFANGRIVLGANNFTLGSSATVTTPTASKYFVTSSTGQLIRPISTSAVTFDVGNSAYNPITLTPSVGTNIPYQVRVIDAVTSPAPFNSTKLINRYWSIVAPTAAANTLTLNGQWNTGEANANYAAGSQVKVAYNNGSVWAETNSTQVGANPFTSSGSFAIAATDLNTGINFGIGKDDGFINSAATYTWNGATDSDWGTSTNWTPNGIPGAADNVLINVPGTNPLIINSSRTIVDMTVSGTGNFSTTSAGTLNITGTPVSSTSATVTLNCASTVNISSSLSKTIPAWNFGNLNATGGDRSWANGATTGICGTFTPGAGTYTTTGSTVAFNGTGAQSIAAAASFATINITNTGGVVTANGNITVATAFTINSNAVFAIASGVTTFNSGSSINVNGTLRNSTASNIVQTGATVTVGATGTYDHNRAGGGAILTATWSTGSNCLITGSPGTAPSAGLSQSFSDFTWSASNSANIILASALTSVGRDFNVTNTGAFNLTLASTAALTLNIGRDLNVSGGTLVVVDAANTNATTVNVANNLNISSTGSLVISGATASGAGVATLAVTGAASVTSSSASALVGALFTKAATITIGNGFTQNGSGTISLSQGSTGNGTMTITSGDFTLTAGNFYMNNASSASCALNLNGASNTFNVNGGQLNLLQGGSGPATRPIITIAGHFSQTNGNIDFAPTYAGGANPVGEIAVAKNFTRSGSGYIRVGGTSINNARITFNGTSQTYTSTTSGNFTRTNMTVNSGSTLTLANDIVFDNTTTPAQTLTVSTSGTVIFGTNTVTNPGGTSTSASTVIASGANVSTANTAGFTASAASGTIQTGVRSYHSLANYTFNGGAGQGTGNFFTITSPTLNAVNNVILNNSNGVSLDATATVQGTLTFTNGSITLGANDLTVVAYSGSTSSKYVITNSTGQMKQTLGSPVTTALVLYPVGNSAYNPISISNSTTFDVYGVRVVDGAVANAYDNTKAVNRAWVVTETSAGGSSLSVVAQYNSGEEGTNFGAGTTPYVAFYKGTAPWVQVSATPAGAGPYTYTAGSSFSPADMTSGTQYFAIGKDDAFVAPTTSYTWTGASDSDWANSGNWSPAGVPAAADDAVISSTGTNQLVITSARAINDFTVSGSATFTVTSAGSLTIGGNVTATTTVLPTLDCASTISIAASTSQNIPAWNFGNLNTSGGTRVLPNGGTVGICGLFTRGAGAQTTTGSTVNYNGTGSQTISLGFYNNLTVSQNRGGGVITLPSGTIDVGGTFTASLSNYTSVVTSNVINFSSASSQDIPAFNYGSITNTGNGPRVWANTGVIDINDTFSQGTNTQTVTGSTIRYSSTAVVTYNLASFTSSASPRHYNNLEMVGGASTQWTLASGFNLGCAGNFSLTGAGIVTVANNTTANTMTVDGNMSISGTGTVRVSSTATAATVGTLTVAGNTTVSNGVLNLVASTAGTTVQGNFTTGDLTISGTGQLLLDAASNSSVATATVNGNLNVTSTTANAINIGSGTANTSNRINIKGNFTKSGTGTLGLTGTATASAGYFFNGTGTQQMSYSGAAMTSGNFTVEAGATVQLTSGITLGTSASAGACSFNTTGTGIIDFGSLAITAGNGANTFSLSATGTFRTASATGVAGSLSGFTSGNCTFTSGGAFDFTGTSVNTGFSTFTGITAANNYTISWNGSTSLTLDKAIALNTLNFNNSGLINLGNFNMTIAATGSITGSSFSSSKMITTDGTGILIRSVSSATGIPFTWPIGETASGAEYSPVTIGSISGNATTGSYGFKVTDGIQPNMGVATSYLSRYWTITTTGLTSGTAWGTATFNYDAADIVVGPEASLKANVYDATGSLWTEFAATSSAASNVLTFTSGATTATVLSGNDITGRIDVPIYYQSNVTSGVWTSASSWVISSDPAFLIPAGIPASTSPTSANSAGITILNGHTISSATTITVDQVTVNSGGKILVTNNSFTVANGTGTDLTIASGGTIEFASATNNSLVVNTSATVQVDGLMKQSGSASPDVSNSGTITVSSTGTYQHARNAGIIPTATWASGSTCLLTAVTNNVPTGLTQAFHHFTVNTTLTANVNCSSALTTINGKFKLTTNHATNAFALGSAGAFTLNIADSLIVTNGILNITNGAGTAIVNANGPVVMNGSTSALTKKNATTATWNFNSDFIQNAGLLDFNEAGASTTTVNFFGNVVMNGTVGRSGSATSTANFVKASGTQTWSMGATTSLAGAILWNIGNGTSTNTVQLLSNIPLSSSLTTFTVLNNATLDCGPYVLTGTNTTFTLNATGKIKSGHAGGIVTAPTANGSIQTLARNFPATASYFYNGTANQVTGNALPATLTTTGNLNIQASAGITVTLTTAGTTTPTFNLLSGLFAAGTGVQLNITTGGTVNASGGDWVTGNTAGILNFPGTGTFTGNSNPYNVYTSGGVNFGSGTVSIQNGGTFRINAGGFVNTNAPFYSTGSTLQYNTASTTAVPYGRGLEWSASSGRGYPHHVQISNATTVNPAATSAVNASVVLRTAGDVTIDANSNLFMDSGGNNMIEDLVIGGSLNLNGSLSGSATSGSDIYVAGNWTNNGTVANFFPNSRGVFLNGTSTQTMSGTNTLFPAFPFLLIDKTAGVVTLGRAIEVSNTLTFTAANVGIVDATSFNLYVSNNSTSAIVRTGSGHVNGNLRRAFNTGTNTYNFTVGDATSYAPVSIAANSVSVAGSMTASTTSGDHAQIASSGLDNTKSVNRTWTLSQSGLTLSNYNPIFNFNNPADLDAGANTSNFIVGLYNGSSWSAPTVGTKTSTSTEATGVTTFGSFAIAECVAPTVYTVSGSGTFCGSSSVDLSGSQVFVTYQLQLNGSDIGSPVVGTGSAISFTGQTASGTYTINAVNTNYATCNAVMSGNAVLVITPTVTPSVSITVSLSSTICSATSVTFTATPTFGGASPSYQWKLNGGNVGTNSDTYTNAALTNGDVVLVVMTADPTVCPSPATATSNSVTMTVIAYATPTVTIAASPSTTICSGDAVTFTATPTFGGGTPVYQWKLNGSNVGTNSSTYSNASLVNGDLVTCVLTSDYICLATPTATSNTLTMTVIAAPQVDAGNPLTTCGSTPYTFPAGASSSATTSISWTTTGAGTFTGTSTLTPTYTPSAGEASVGAIITFTFTGVGSSPCGSVSDNVVMTVNALVLFYTDADGDGFGNALDFSPVAGCVASPPVGKVANNTDCCDSNADINPMTEWWADMDGDGYGSFVYQTGCISACTIPAQLIPYYLGAHGNVPYALDCNDNSVTVYPLAPEICQNLVDDDCDGSIDEGCSGILNDTYANAVTINTSNPNTWYPNCLGFNGTLVNADISGQANPANVAVGGGRDVWYRFSATSTGAQIKVVPSGFNAVIELRTAAHPVGQVDVENANSTIGGAEILNTNSLIIGQTYYVAVRNFNATNVGTFTLCVSPLMPSGCALTEPVGGFPLCTNYKAVYRGANTYTFNFTGTGGAAAFPYVTTSASSTGLIAMSTPALDLRYGGEYNARVDANYNLFNGAGAAEPTITVLGNVATANCTGVSIISQPMVEVKATQRCPAVLTRSMYLIATPTTGSGNVCSAISYSFRFTQVTDCTGATTSGLPFTVTNTTSTPYLYLAQAFTTGGGFPLPNMGTWKVEVRPNFSYGSGTFGPPQYIQVNGTSTSVMAPDSNEMIDAERSFEEQPNTGLYPNPSNGEMLNINVTDVKSDNVIIRITDAVGRQVYYHRFMVDGSLSTSIVFDHALTSGLYMVEFTVDDKTIVERMMIEK